MVCLNLYSSENSEYGTHSYTVALSVINNSGTPYLEKTDFVAVITAFNVVDASLITSIKRAK